MGKVLFYLSLAFLLTFSFVRLADAAPNPSGSGQPSVECGEDGATAPAGFLTDGFAKAEEHYAGSGGSLNSGNEKAVSQYDVACYQLSN